MVFKYWVLKVWPGLAPDVRAASVKVKDIPQKSEKVNLKLKLRIEGLEKIVSEQNVDIVMKISQLKDYAKAADDQIAILWEEIEEVKREKDISVSTVTTFEDENEKIKFESDKVRNENAMLKVDKKDIVSELKTVSKDNVYLEKFSNSLEKQIEKLKEGFKYLCEHCTEESTTKDSLTDHVRTNLKNISKKCTEYSCYYWRKKIHSCEELKNISPFATP